MIYGTLSGLAGYDVGMAHEGQPVLYNQTGFEMKNLMLAKWHAYGSRAKSTHLRKHLDDRP